MSRALRSFAVIAALGTALGACASASTRFYTLDALAPAGVDILPYAGPPIRIDAVHVPPAFDRVELVQETSANRFTISDNDHWAAPLDGLLRRVLTQGVAARLPSGKVIFPDSPKPIDTSSVVVDILALSPSSAGMVMDVGWTVSLSHAPGSSPSPQPLHHMTLRLTTPATGAGVSGDAAEISALADQLSNAIARDIVGAPL